MTGSHGLPRIADVAIAGLGLLLTGPLLVLLMVAIRFDSAGAAIYRQRRVGRDGEEFDLLKLRTMARGADPCLLYTSPSPRDRS